MKKYILALLTVVAIFANSLVPTAFAQTTASVGPGNGFRVSPVRQELTIQPGKNEVVNVSVENITNEDIVAHPVVNDFIASDAEDGQPRLLLDDSKPQSGNSFRNLIGTINDIPLKPHERKTIKVTVNVPANASGGGYYGAIRFSPSDGGDPKQVALTASVGVLFLVKVPGQIIEKLDLLTLGACIRPYDSNAKDGSKLGPCKNPGSLFISSPNDIEIRLKNPGTIHLQPNGRVRVKNWRGKIISDVEFNGTDPRGNILPNSIRHFDVAIAKTVDNKLVNVKSSFGLYTIEANLGYGTGGGDLITAKATYWVLPIWFLVLVGVLIISIVVAVFVIRKQRHGKRRYR